MPPPVVAVPDIAPEDAADDGEPVAKEAS
jgi:hypothetical protein